VHRLLPCLHDLVLLEPQELSARWAANFE
jgi:hypothetical protein